jgi:putative tryptophan/tyrosine transport system substrate-binding protein
MRWREFVAGLGSAVALPVVVRAQEREQMRRIGVLMLLGERDPRGSERARDFHSALTQALADLGWTDGRNVRMDVRAGLDPNRMRALAQELVGLQPDIIVVSSSTPGTVAARRETRTIPIVFASLGDPVASGLVVTLNQPGGNITGFANMDATLRAQLGSAEFAPRSNRALML